MTLAAIGLIAAIGAGPTSAVGFNGDLTTVDFTTWDLRGAPDPAHVDGAGNLVLTTAGTGDSIGTAFAPSPAVLDMNQPFAFNFLFRIDAGQVVRGDGLTFVLLAEPGLGQAGSGLGYQGLSGVAFAIDTFNFESEPESPSLQILKDGVVNPPHAFFETTLGNGIRAGEWAASVSYTPSGNSDETGTLLGTISHGTLGLYSVSAEVDMSLVGNAVFDGDGFYIGREVFYGFTAANGLADDGHLILTAVPEPSTYVTVLAGLGLLGWRLRRRRAPQA